MAFSGYFALGHQHRPGLLQGHGPTHGPRQQSRPDVIMSSKGSSKGHLGYHDAGGKTAQRTHKEHG